MYGKKKTPAQKRSCYKMKPKSPILKAKKKCKKCGSPICMCGPKHRK